jgi:spermidine synthase
VLAIACGALLFGLGHDVRTSRRAVTDSARNFYGVLSVTSTNYPEEGEVHELKHGITTHGLQFLDPGKNVWPTTYYSAQSGAGLLFRHFQNQLQRNIGVVGLGVGTLATYAREGDRIRFYEINPQVVEMAARHFTYLDDTPAQVRVALGDARLTMERESPRGYDMLFLDAFSSHSVPVHLLTVEAFETYLRHLAPNGVIAVHVSHMFLDLQPVVRGAGEALGLDVLYIANRPGPPGFWQSHWMLLTRSAELRDSDFIQQAMQRLAPSTRSLAVWTDDHSDVLSLLKRRGRGA